jgi:DMSO/TMAO reductase YedYZ molybdopterin-dependent catalytic subunit
VRWSRWLNVLSIPNLIVSGIAIYWASPIYQHKPDPNTGNFDVVADIGIWICAHVPGLHHYSSPPDWVYNHMSLGPGMLAAALRLHWFWAGALAALAGAGYLLPQETLSRIGVRRNMNSTGKEWFLNRALRIDDDVAEALYSGTRRVPTYTKSQITPLKNNYNGATPDPGYISGWKLTLEGLASGLSISLDIRNLMTRFSIHDQITRLVCAEGWSAIAWWSGLRFDDLIRAYPPMSQAKWAARVESSINLDASGNPDPYFMSIDLATARHPQTLLATHFNGQPLTVDHGAPLRLLVPVKLGLKNVKAITRITYSAEEPRDYWAERGYSRYDGI